MVIYFELGIIEDYEGEKVNIVNLILSEAIYLPTHMHYG